MAENTSQFGMKEGDSFTLKTPESEQKSISLESPADLLRSETGDKPIVLKIGEASNLRKLLEHSSADYVQLTGNVIVDAFKQVNGYFIAHSKVNIRQKATFFRLLSVMINSGLTIIRSLDTLAEQSAKEPKLRYVVYDLARQVEQGKSLSEGMAMHSDVFDEAQVGMVKSGEVSGQLNLILNNIANDLEKNASIQSKVVGAMIYPCVIMSLMIVVVIVMMTVVVPKISELFLEQSQALPLFTQILITTSTLMRDHIVLMLLFFVALIALFIFWKNTPTGRYNWDLFVLKIPLFGPLIQKSVLSRFSRSMSNLLGSGVPIVPALKIIAGGIGNEGYREKLLLAAKDLEQGIPLAENLSDSKLFPTMLVNMIEVGEQTAQLETVTEKVALFYDEEVDNAVKTLTKVMEPLILVTVGVVVGGIVAAVMLPIIQLTGNAGGGI